MPLPSRPPPPKPSQGTPKTTQGAPKASQGNPKPPQGLPRSVPQAQAVIEVSKPAPKAPEQPFQVPSHLLAK